MKCEVKNVQSSEVFSIPPDGMIFGRAGGPANITVSDQSVSKRHARIFCKDGQWLLEDLKSVNGTVVNNRRITEPVPITPGFVFALSKHQFEVVSVDGAAQGRPAMKGSESDPRGRSKSQQAIPSPKSRSAGGPSGQPVPVPDAEPLLPPEPSRSRSAMQALQEPEPSEYGAQQDPYLDELGGGGAEGGAGAVIAALPKAVAYYLAAVPMMALNPIGTIKRGVETPKLKAMGALELIAFILPVQVVANLIGSWAAAIAGLITGTFSVMLFFPVVGIIVSVVVSVISGFIAHPVLKFIVERIFKGETDEKTRTNAMIMLQTAAALVAIPNALAVLLTGVIAKLSASFGAASLLQIIPALLIAVTAPLAPFILWQWFKAWRTASWAQTVMLVLVVLAALAGVGGAVRGIVGAIHMMHSGGSAVVDVDTSKLSDDAKKALEDAKKAADKAGDDAKKAADKAGDDGKKAVDDAKDDGKKAADDAKKAADTAADDAKKAAADKGDDGKKAADDAKVATPPPSTPAGRGYPEYKRKRDAVEKTIAADPTFLNRRGVYELYSDLSKCSYKGVSDAESQVLGRKKRYDPSLKQLLDAVREEKTYENCAGTVDKLYRVLPHD